MTRTHAKATLVVLALAAGLAACSTMNEGRPLAAADSATVAQSSLMRSAGNTVSNPTNGGPAYVGGTGR